MNLVSFIVFYCFIQGFLSENGVVITKMEVDREDVLWSVVLPSGYTRWKVEMKAQESVSEINIVSDSQPIRTLTLQVVSREREEKICITVRDSAKSWERPAPTCVNHPRYARYVIIKKSDGFPLAEIKVFAKKLEKEGVDPNLRKISLSDSSVLRTERFIDMRNLVTEQGGTWNNHGSELAIDGNSNTYSVACMKCDQGLSGGPGWWQVDLGRERAVTGVTVYTSLEHTNARYFNNVQIFVGSSRSMDPRDARMCHEFSSKNSYPPGHKYDCDCTNKPLIGRFLTIRRQRSAEYRPDAIALAEVQIYENPYLPELSFETKIFDNAILMLEKNTAYKEPGQIPVQGQIQAIQSGTWKTHHAYLALDGNPNTWSIADTNENTRYKGKTAWWQADLGSIRTLTDVSITSSTDIYNAAYLQDISVDVSQSSAADTTNSLIQCNSHRGNIQAGETINIKCKRGVNGRYVIIRRASNSGFRPDALTLAEVRLSYY